MLPVVTKCIKVTGGIGECICYVHPPATAPAELNFMKEVKQVTKQALFWKMLSTITETSLWEALTQSIYHLGQVAEHLGALWLQQSATTWVNQRINIYYEIS